LAIRRRRVDPEADEALAMGMDEDVSFSLYIYIYILYAILIWINVYLASYLLFFSGGCS